ncbi:MAG: gamma carbonic anhydrase family protein, partial [Candidatus Micrarchaeota archaeon]|nr:gamma carbonic anhydrase family protein [Candidatus Micrarchaeota archaeon]
MPIREYDGKVPKIDQTSYIEPSANIIGEVILGKDTSIWNGVVLRG